jgi:hypothetical protein
MRLCMYMWFHSIDNIPVSIAATLASCMTDKYHNNHDTSPPGQLTSWQWTTAGQCHPLAFHPQVKYSRGSEAYYTVRLGQLNHVEKKARCEVCSRLNLNAFHTTELHVIYNLRWRLCSWWKELLVQLTVMRTARKLLKREKHDCP